ncbi:hypothetical protein F383_37196 [Gossypium arboreum]|uniref:Uncharacterized protein n=1 Tax=Gossypium arboreum TaxID=29729 RepID=A0A0B0MG05_GOSAR|nr:hypothetical protein F383_37196 [Gossypium arboreum]
MINMNQILLTTCMMDVKCTKCTMS